jgi:hypothetical protein
MPSLAGYGPGCQVPLLCFFAIESAFQVLCSSFQYSPSQITMAFNFPAQDIQQQLYLLSFNINREGKLYAFRIFNVFNF